MKRIFLSAICLSLAGAVIPAYAQDSAAMHAIFKIQAYSYNRVSDVYTMDQYGSAVLIAKNILLTNAHVITDANDALTLQYEACKTVSDDEAPVCFSTLQLLRYDKNSDLALLQIVDPVDDMPDPVTMGSGALTVGSSISIVGYPANGGETITTTQGTIAGSENGYYKTDANVDEGNSGGGGFDSAGTFIGIPTFVVNGQTTLGYIIPTDTIKRFIAGEIGTTYKPKFSAAFDKRRRSIYTITSQGSIDNNLFTTANFTGIGLYLDSAIEKTINNLYRYNLYDQNDSLVNMLSLIATDNTAISRYTSNSIKQLSDSGYKPKKSTKRIGSTTWNVIMFGDENGIGYDYIQTSSTNKTYLEFIIFADIANAKDLSGLVQFVENTIIKKTYAKPQVFAIPAIKLSSKRDISIVKRLKEGGITVSILPNDGKYAAEISLYNGSKGDTLKKVVQQVRDGYETIGYTVTSETSKYPSSVAITSITDENDKESLSILMFKRYGGNDIYVHMTVTLNTSAAKSAAIALAYRMMGLQ